MAAPALSQGSSESTLMNRSVLNLDKHGITDAGHVHGHLAPAELIEHALRRGESQLASTGTLVSYTGERTGRSPQDRYVDTELDETPRQPTHVAWVAARSKRIVIEKDDLHPVTLKRFPKKARRALRAAFAPRPECVRS